MAASTSHTCKNVTYDAGGKVLSCLFCNILSGTEPGHIVLSNSKYFVFRNKYPVTKNHLLVSPREHVQNFDMLKGDAGAVVVQEMMDIGKQAIATLNETNCGLKESKEQVKEVELLQCFHVPPINSVDHLHLHIIPNPATMSYFNYMKYLTNTRWCITGDRACEILKSST